MLPEIDIKTINGKNLLIVKVPHQKGPYYIRSEGDKEGVYIRFGSTTRKASLEIIADILRLSSNLTFDQLPCSDLMEDDLDQESLERFFKRVVKITNKTETLRTLGVLINRSGKLIPSNGGIILFGKEEVRSKFFSDARISCARFKGIDKSHFIDRQDVEGTIFEALDGVIKFISRNTRLSSVIKSLRREDIPEYPEIPLREVLINAIVHGNYAISGRIFISIFDDRLEIQNPGMLPYGITLEDFKSGISHIRNKVIARVFRELNLIEEWGSGYNRIVSYCQQLGYIIPEWQEFGTVTRVIFRPHPSLIEHQPNIASNVPIEITLTSRHQEIVEILGEKRELKMKEILSLLKNPPAERTLRDDLSFLKSKGLIGFKGHAKSAVWFIL